MTYNILQQELLLLYNLHTFKIKYLYLYFMFRTYIEIYRYIFVTNKLYLKRKNREVRNFI